MAVGSSEKFCRNSNLKYPLELFYSLHVYQYPTNTLKVDRKQLFYFLWKQKKYWLMPIIMLLILLIALVIMGENSVVAPFIYSLF